jgi:parallel beta-helix repeat protein
MEATVIYVNDSGGADYTTIQEAIDNANPGDTVYVYNGTYYENVVLNKTINLIGEDRNTTIIDGIISKDVINVTVDWANISNFNVMGGKNGIMLYNTNNCSINNVYLSNNNNGLYLFRSFENIISGNHIEFNSEHAIYLYDSNKNHIDDTYFSSNQKCIYLFSSDDNNITNNNINNNGYAFHLLFSSKNDLSNNNVSNASRGVFLDSSLYNNIISNNLTSNTESIYLVSSSFNNITNNDIISNIGDGIYISSGGGNYIKDNIIFDNSDNGILIDGATNNRVINNYLSNNKYGILLNSCSSNTLESNTMINNGVFILGDFLYQFNRHNIETSNTVNGNPIYYWKNETSGEIPSGAGQIIIVNSTNIIIRNQELANTYAGIQLGFSSDNLLYENNAYNNLYGIYLIYSNANNIINNTLDFNYQTGLHVGFSTRNNISGNDILSNNGNGLSFSESNDNNITRNNMSLNFNNGLALHNSLRNNITKNNIFANQNYGIDIKSSQNNQIYHNNIINNTDQSDDDSNNMNQWDNGYPSGGNFWSDYVGSDIYKGSDQDESGSDGIGDSPYPIDFDSEDNYPLMKPWLEDTTPPLIQLISPENNSIIKPGVIINLDIFDLNINEVIYKINEGLEQTLVSPYDLNTSGWKDDNYIISIQASDKEGNLNTSSYNFIIDSQSPVIILNSPQNNTYVALDFIINFSISDNNLYSSSYSINNGTTSYFSYPYILNASDWQEGAFFIRIYADDSACNNNNKWFVIIKDTIEPSITLISPQNGSIITESSIIDFNISDANIKTVSYSRNQGLFSDFYNPYDLDTTEYDDGEYIIRIKVEDNAGNKNEKWYYFYIDTTSPFIKSTSINNNAENIDVGTELIIEFNEPMDTKSVESSISISPFTEHSLSWRNNNTTLEINFSETLEYETFYTISISTKAKDMAGLELEEKLELGFTTEDKLEVKNGEEFPVLNLIVVFIIMALIAILLVVLVLSRKKKLTLGDVQIEVTKNIENQDQIQSMNQPSINHHSHSSLPAQDKPQSSLSPQQPSIQISCPNCNYKFPIVKTKGPMQVQCPNCGTKGTIK